MSLPAFSFATATQIRFGRGEAGRAVPDLAARGQRVLLVQGSTPARADWLSAALEAEGCSVDRLSVAAEPDLAMIEAGVTAARASAAQVVIALGGGAVIDAGKAIAALAPATRPLLDHLEVVGKGLPLNAAPLPFAAIPTTAGTGAEVTRNAVIAVPEAQRKVSLRDARMLPWMAIVDPALTDNCPRSVTLASGLDAVTQVIEPYVCTRANPMTDALCRPAIVSGLAALMTLMRHEDPDARDQLAWTSLCGGLALANAGLGAVHGLAGPLGGLSGAAHGAICGILLPHVLEENAARATGDAARRLADLRDDLGRVLGTDPARAFAALADWSRKAGLPGLDAQGVNGEHRAEAARMAASSSSMKANPVPLDAEALTGIMERAR
ncbi:MULTISPECIES: iron-containing alcohol dehydrogenase [Mameliella]|uniref:iron-containing alcohol dehydrogenase n=1 Tax=Mameliella sp. LZ-28 TaxID=2484146 RepID=UPI000B52D867|nr:MULTISPECIES: iron-containing alcohol dehydrogenase [Mameliella]MCR9272384.1 iron-containing alcohol dehydrogenase [Paracoccaceae bacterium]OWV61807.1 alcohol dehydrogenase [Mameliella alba]